MAPTVYDPPVNTYIPLGSVTLSATATEVTFAGIDQSYRDLIVVYKVAVVTGGGGVLVRFNGDTGSNYQRVIMNGDGSFQRSFAYTETSFRSENYADIDENFNSHTIFQIMDYSALDKHKSILSRSNNNAASNGVNAVAARWANTSAITSMSLTPSTSTFKIGSTFSIYGIAG